MTIYTMLDSPFGELRLVGEVSATARGGVAGALTGYAGGIHRKHELLTHEGALQPQLI
jgi:hypothetical protein